MIEKEKALEQRDIKQNKLNKLVAVLSSRWRREALNCDLVILLSLLVLNCKEIYQNAFPACGTIIVSPLSTNNTCRGCYFRSLSCIWNKMMPQAFSHVAQIPLEIMMVGLPELPVSLKLSLSETPPTFEKKKSKNILLWRTNRRWLTTLPKSVILHDQPKV